MPATDVAEAFARLTGGNGRLEPTTAMSAVAAVVAGIGAQVSGAESGGNGSPAADATAPGVLLDTLVLLRWAQAELAVMEPALIGAARQAGVSWQSLASTLGVASRQAAERRYLRLIAASAEQQVGTRDGRVRAERDRRASHRAVAQWANDNTADLRRLAGQVTALTDLGEAAGDGLDRLHQALADADASALPRLLADARPHLAARHPDLAGQIESVTANTEQVRRETQQRRDATLT